MKKTIMIIVAVVLVGYAGYRLWGAIGEDPDVVSANSRPFMDSETGEVFEIELKEGMTFPLENPKTGKRTLYTAEICFAGKCLEKGGTPVILNQLLGKEGPTYCPNCGALVVFHNPGPAVNDMGGGE